MKKGLKKLVAVILTAAVALSVAAPAVAAEEEFNYEEYFPYEKYLEQVEQGYIGEDVTYEMLAEVNEQSFAEYMASNENFTLIYEGDSSVSPLALVGTLNPGDVFIMDDTLTSSAIMGHAAMALSNTEIVNIAGEGSVAQVLTRSQFDNYYKNKGRGIKIYRSNNYNWGVNAALWADATYRNANIPYKITTDLRSTSSTYCSKIVYQAYCFGAGSTAMWREENYNIVGPYGLKNYIKIYEHGEYDTV